MESNYINFKGNFIYYPIFLILYSSLQITCPGNQLILMTWFIQFLVNKTSGEFLIIFLNGLSHLRFYENTLLTAICWQILVSKQTGYRMNRKSENYDDSDECQILTQPIASVLIYGLCQVKWYVVASAILYVQRQF